MAATADSQKKGSRFSRLLGTKRDKSPDQPPTFPPDSAYASSDGPTPSAARKSTPEIVPAEKNSEIANIDKDRNLGLKPSTGEVLDRDTGEIVTVVTTTTTTTTTTTRKPGQKKPAVHKDVQETTQTQPAVNGTPPNNSSHVEQPRIAEMPATPGTPGPQPVPVEPQVPEPRASSANRLRKQSPGIPARSANRISGDRSSFAPSMDGHYPSNTTAQPGPNDTSYFARPGPTGNTPPLSPARTNYSYPAGGRNNRNSLDGVSLVTTDTQQAHNKSTMADLRAAAKGIHGVGETLRGTFNSAVDDNFPRKNAKKAAKARDKNEAVLARGREEVAGIPHRNRDPNSLAYTPSTHDQQHASSPYPPPAASGPGYDPAVHGRPPIPQTNMASATAPPIKPPSPQRTPTADQSVPGSWSPDYDENEQFGSSTTAAGPGAHNKEREREKSKSISKLFKRKPVTAKEGELRDRKYY